MQAAAAIALSVLFTFAISGCQFFNGDTPLLIDDSQPIAYIKRSVDNQASQFDPLHYQLGSDLYVRDLANLEGTEHPVTTLLTAGSGDVADPEPSYDGKTIIFSMRCTQASSAECSSDTTWNIWTYNIETGISKRVITDFTVANLGDDREPVYLPDGRIAFISTRQAATQDQLGYQYITASGAKPAAVLHVMNADGTGIQQISFNQNHERNPTVLANGKIMFSRLETVDGVSKYSLFTINPDGSGLTSLYGAHSPGDAFLHARELEDGRVIASVLPAGSKWEGGALMLLDVKNFSNADMPAPGLTGTKLAVGGQKSATLHEIPLDENLSRYGRYAKPFPIPDGSNDVLVSYSFYHDTIQYNLGVGASGQNQDDQSTLELSISDEKDPVYGLYLLNTQTKSLLPILLPDKDKILTDPIALTQRKKPSYTIPAVAANPNLFAGNTNEGLINIKSVYDTDRLGYMGPQAQTPAERASMPIPMVAPVDPSRDSREKVADIAKLKDPLQTPAEQRPARFIRIVEAQFIPPGISQQAIGETSYGMRRIFGYTDVEPDGSAIVKVPADRPFTVSVVDQYGRAFHEQSSWLYVSPGETLECKGCHAPRDDQMLNQAPIAGNHPNTNLTSVTGQQFFATAQPGETMAETRARVDTSSIEPNFAMSLYDVWGNNFTQNEPDQLGYINLTTAQPQNGIIDYRQYIQPIFDAQHSYEGGTQSCSGCHDGVTDKTNNPSGLNLTASVGGTGRNNSYEALLNGNVLFDDKGRPVFEQIGEASVLKRQLPLVKPGFARGSYLVEKIFNEELFADRGLPEAGLNHASMLSPAEKRLISEWIDLGAQYYNSPFDELDNPRTISGSLSKTGFFQAVSPLLQDKCPACHTSMLSGGVPNKSYKETNFFLTGGDSDFYLSAELVDIENPEQSRLLVVPMTSAGHIRNGVPMINTTSPLYINVLNWIQEAQQQSSPLQLSVPYVRN